MELKIEKSCTALSVMCIIIPIFREWLFNPFLCTIRIGIKKGVPKLPLQVVCCMKRRRTLNKYLMILILVLTEKSLGFS